MGVYLAGLSRGLKPMPTAGQAEPLADLTNKARKFWLQRQEQRVFLRIRS